MITLVLPLALKSLNQRQRMHWAALMRYRNQIALEVTAAFGGTRYFPRPPLKNVRISVCRHSQLPIDPDNLAASCKSLLDVLCVKSNRHPCGLGIIEDDNPDQCKLVTSQARGKPTTTIIIECL